jgi:hypothetical protein
MSSQPAHQRKKLQTNHKLPGSNKRKQPDKLTPNDVLQEGIGRHSRSKRAVHIAARTKAAHNKAVAEAMELQIDSSGGNKRKYALTEIKADIAKKRLYVRRSLPPIGGGTSTQPSLTGGNHPPHPHPKPDPKGKHNMASRTTKTNKATTAPPTPTQTPAHGTTWDAVKNRRGPRAGEEP